MHTCARNKSFKQCIDEYVPKKDRWRNFGMRPSGVNRNLFPFQFKHLLTDVCKNLVHYIMSYVGGT